MCETEVPVTMRHERDGTYFISETERNGVRQVRAI
jgi:hypothetical protein